MKKIISLFAFISLLTSTISAFSQDGTLDLSFSGDGVANSTFGSGLFTDFNSVKVQDDGKIVTAGYVYNSTDYDFAIARHNDDGSPDLTFGTTGLVQLDFLGGSEVAYDLLVQSDNKIIVGGYTANGGITDFVLVRLNPDGTYDNSFGTNGITTTDFMGTDYLYALAIQDDGKIIAAGTGGPSLYADFTIARYQSDGTLDLTFGTNGLVTTDFGNIDQAEHLKIQPDGKIIVSGSAFSSNTDYALARYNNDGSLDLTFGIDGKVICAVGSGDDYGLGLGLQSDGKIIMGGYSTLTFGGEGDFSAARFNSDGSLDLTFSSDGKLVVVASGSDTGLDLTLQIDNKIVICGYRDNGSDMDVCMIRLLPDGSLDNSFDTDGIVVSDFGGNNYANAITEDHQGRFLLAGLYQNDEFLLARYNGNSLGNDEIQTTYNVLVYPNPTNGNFVIETQNEIQNASLKITDISGKIIYCKENLSGTNFQIDLSNQPAGIYFLEVNDEGTTQRIKVVKN